MKTFFGFFVRRPLLVNLALVFVVLAGFLALKSMRFDTYPSIDLGVITVHTLYPGAAAEDVELSVTVPLEEEILKVDGLHKLVSQSMEGLSTLVIHTDPNNSKVQNRIVADDLQKAIDRASARLPGELPQKPELETQTSDILPIMELFISGPVPEETLRVSARNLQNALRELSGVAGVVREGYRKKEVRVLLEPERLHKLGISYNEIAQAIQRRNLRDSGGSLESFVSEKQVVTVGQFEDPKDVEDVIVRSSGPGNYVRVRDIATVVYDFEDLRIQATTNGHPGISLYIRKKTSADGLDTSRKIREFLEDYQKNLPPGVEISIFNDLSRFTSDMLEVLIGNAGLGIVLVFLVVWSFFPWRFTAWVTVGIPAAIFMAFAVMPFFDLSINQVTMASMILMLGILVDDAVVTSESIYRQNELGDPPLQAAINGTTSVAPPVIASALTTILAFAPAAFLSGNEGKFMWTLPAMAIVVLFASLIESQLMLPAHIHHSLRHDKAGQGRRWFNFVEAQYFRLMTLAVRRRFIASVIFIGACAAITFFSLRVVNINLYPDVNIDAFHIKAEMSQGTAFENTRGEMEKLADIVRDEIPPGDLINMKVVTGHHKDDLKNISEGEHVSWGLISVYLKPLGDRESNSMDLVSQLRERLKDQAPFTSLMVIPQRETPPTGKAVEVEVIGNDDARYEVSARILQFLQQHPAVTESWSSYKPGKDVIKLRLNHEAIADHGLQVADITQAVRIAFDGTIIDELQTVDERIDYRLQFSESDQGRVETLRSLTVINQNGFSVPLRALVDFEIELGEASIKHYFGDRTITVFAEIDREKTSTVQINTELEQFIEEQNFQENYSRLRIKQGGELAVQKEALGSVVSAFVLCLVGILFLLVVMFNSLTQPLLIASFATAAPVSAPSDASSPRMLRATV